MVFILDSPQRTRGWDEWLNRHTSMSNRFIESKSHQSRKDAWLTAAAPPAYWQHLILPPLYHSSASSLQHGVASSIPATPFRSALPPPLFSKASSGSGLLAGAFCLDTD
ncbi:hypothetical protein JDV02_006101 [Purpureocillium takamizusanense]|uniref:Uncharacterized protein n=1 Tax=Purpureocillium takamizusanense TaxID=2060973 RepID=A0A9Q8QFN0_9HYPO|nr:uncharacterized protein JDV02_006101 [Purpureocillium takamizusanense]UNI19959.1 hypothetical protein JDV02_006101 [Purpureocillium takamizusanense]